MNGENSRYGNVRRPVNINYNPFDPLMDENIVCYKCNNLGHKAQYCREMKEDNHMPNVCIPTTTWKRKEIPHNEIFRIALVAKGCKEEDEWFIDSGCSSYSLHSLATNAIQQYSFCGIYFLFHVLVGMQTFDIRLSSFISLKYCAL